MMPKQKPGKSKQDYHTPPEFIQAVKNKLRIQDFTVDLAADEHNSVGLGYFDLPMNSLEQSWRQLSGWNWLNPPFDKITPWVQKAAMESLYGAHIAMLVPASVGSNWWNDYVTRNSYQLFLNGRITFQGCVTPYPKDCALLLYTPMIRSGNATWTWKNYV